MSPVPEFPPPTFSLLPLELDALPDPKLPPTPPSSLSDLFKSFFLFYSL
jgi:hypothetical protein